MSRGFTTSTGKTLLKQDLLTKRKKARNAHINGIYQQIEKIILAINPSFSRSTIKKFVETYQDILVTNSVANSTSINLKNKIYDTGKIWLQHYGLELPTN